MTTIKQYTNGNYHVTLLDDGTKIRETEADELLPEFPEQADCKITNWCNNPICAEFCHEQSNKNGVHGDLNFASEILSTWNKGVEVAIGGGSTLSHPDILPFLREIQRQDKVANVTVNHFHINSQRSLIEKVVGESLVHGVGVSYLPSMDIKTIQSLFKNNKNLVFHLILGFHTVDDVKFLYENFEAAKVLLLGYKQFGNGVKYYANYEGLVRAKLKYWFTHLHELFNLKDLIVSFDNLGIEQMKVRRFFTQSDWNLFYQGNEGTCSFYMDFVRQEYGLSSTAQKRHKMEKGTSVPAMWKRVKS